MHPLKMKKDYETKWPIPFTVALLVLLIFGLRGMTAASLIESDDPEKKGLGVANENDLRDTGWLDNSARIEMIMTNKHGQSSSRMIRFSTMETLQEGKRVDGDRSLIIFDSPLDVKGTAFLSYAHKDRDDDQWLYLPTLKRVKRISARNKSGSFVGSEFAYEDISSEEVEKYTYQWLRDEIYEAKDCYVIERIPVDKKNTGYNRHIVWYDKAKFLIQKIDYYDRKNSLLKTLTYWDYTKQIADFWRPLKMIMVNHQNGKKTELIWSEREFQSGLSDMDFNKNRLKNIR